MSSAATRTVSVSSTSASANASFNTAIIASVEEFALGLERAVERDGLERHDNFLRSVSGPTTRDALSFPGGPRRRRRWAICGCSSRARCCATASRTLRRGCAASRFRRRSPSRRARASRRRLVNFLWGSVNFFGAIALRHGDCRSAIAGSSRCRGARLAGDRRVSGAAFRRGAGEKRLIRGCPGTARPGKSRRRDRRCRGCRHCRWRSRRSC